MSATESNSKVLVWTVCTFKKETMGEDEFHRYMSETHAPLVRNALARHGITHYTMAHFTASTKALTGAVTDAQFFNNTAYDIITQIRFPDIQCFINFRNDPYYKDTVMADHDIFSDPEKQFMSVGWVEDHIIGGRIVQ